MTLGQKIKAARLEKGLTQKEVVGDYITRNMLSKIENDSATPSVRTLEHLARALDLAPGYFLDDASVSDGSVPDGLDEARAAFRGRRWLDCISALKADQKAATSDEGYLLHARAGAYAAEEARQEGRLNDARELAETAHYYNREGLYYSPALAAQLNLLLGNVLTQLGTEYCQSRQDDIDRLSAELIQLRIPNELP